MFLDRCLPGSFDMPNLICLALDSPLFPQVPGEFSPANFPVPFEQVANITIGGHLPHMSRLSRSTVSIIRMHNAKFDHSQEEVLMLLPVTDRTSHRKRGPQQVCNMASSRLLAPNGNNSLSNIHPLKRREAWGTNECPGKFDCDGIRSH